MVVLPLPSLPNTYLEEHELEQEQEEEEHNHNSNNNIHRRSIIRPFVQSFEGKRESESESEREREETKYQLILTTLIRIISKDTKKKQKKTTTTTTKICIGNKSEYIVIL